MEFSTSKVHLAKIKDGKRVYKLDSASQLPKTYSVGTKTCGVLMKQGYEPIFNVPAKAGDVERIKSEREQASEEILQLRGLPFAEMMERIQGNTARLMLADREGFRRELQMAFSTIEGKCISVNEDGEEHIYRVGPNTFKKMFAALTREVITQETEWDSFYGLITVLLAADFADIEVIEPKESTYQAARDQLEAVPYGQASSSGTGYGANREVAGAFYDHTYSLTPIMSEIYKKYGALNLTHFQIYTVADYETFKDFKDPKTKKFVESDFDRFPLTGTPKDMLTPCIAYSIFVAAASEGINLKIEILTIIDKFRNDLRAQRKRLFAAIMNEPSMSRFSLTLTMIRGGVRVSQSYGSGKIKLSIALLNGTIKHYVANIPVMHPNTPFNSGIAKCPTMDYARRLHTMIGDKPKYRAGDVVSTDALDFASKFLPDLFVLTPINISTDANYDLFSPVLSDDEFKNEISINETISACESKEFEISNKVIRDTYAVNKRHKVNKKWMDAVNFSKDEKITKIKRGVASDLVEFMDFITSAMDMKMKRIAFADTETHKVLISDKDGLKKYIAVPYQFCIREVVIDGLKLDGKFPCEWGKDFEKQFTARTKLTTYTGPDCSERFAKYINENDIELCYFHNLKFDMTVLLKEMVKLDHKMPRSCKKDGALYSVSFSKCKFLDSYKIITMPLRDFADSFGLTAHKEYCNYTWFDALETEGDHFKPLMVSIEGIPQETLEIAMSNGWVHENKLDALKYSEYYCGLDCDVLAMGFLKFHETIYRELGLNVYNYLTASSLADAYLKARGCYAGVHEVRGVACKFIAQCVRGGFCTAAGGHKLKIECDVVDLDSNSLYPSAMRRMPGFPRGEVKQLDVSLSELLDNDNISAWLTVEFSRVELEDPFDFVPICTTKTETGNVSYECKAGKPYNMTLIDLEELIKYGCVLRENVKIIAGYYTAEGHNKLINETIQLLFDVRYALQKAHNKCEGVIKMIMNSAYGKSIIKASQFSESFIDEKKKEAMIRNVNSSMSELTLIGKNAGGHNVYLMKAHKNTLAHSNFGVVGTYILSYSKVIMNEAHYALKRVKDRIAPGTRYACYYRDTDSLQIPMALAAAVEIEYRALYGRELIEGGQLGQFKIDYKLEKDSVGDKLVKSARSAGKVVKIESHATSCYYVGRKVYMSIIKHTVDIDGFAQIFEDLHVRHKGIPGHSLANGAYCNGEHTSGLQDTFERLLAGSAIDFDLCSAGDRLDVKFGSCVAMKTKFTRTSLAPGDVEVITK